MRTKARTRALVTGATGVIGPHLVKRLIQDGYVVRALSRSHHGISTLPNAVETIQGDITDKEILKKAVKNIDIIFHLAAKLHEGRFSPSFQKEFRRVNIEGTRRLAAAAKSAGVNRLIFFSTINVYGHCNSKHVHNEGSPLNPTTTYAGTKAEAEDVVLSEMPAVVLRLAAVYGPGMKGNYQRLLSALKNRAFIMIGNGQNRRTLVHVQDVCQAALLTAMHSAASGRVYNISDGEIHTFREIVNAICSALGRKNPGFQISEFYARRIFGFIEDAFQFCGKTAPIGRFTVEKLLEDMAVCGDKIQTQLGYRPRFNLKAGWKTCVESMMNK